MRILHTADWQIGKPYARIEDPDKRALARRARLETIGTLARVAADEQVDLVVVAGDVFDSYTADKPSVSALLGALRRLARPVVLIPGNHDHGGPGSVWRQAFFRQECETLAPNVRVLLEPGTLEIAGVTIYACPLTRRSESADTTAWLRSGEALAQAAPGTCRLVLAHGATESFGSLDADDEEAYGSNLIDVTRLPEGEYDYLALGDWHGTKQVGPKAWYSGTHEQDRFPKGTEYDAGNVLIAELSRGQAPQVKRVATGMLTWLRLAHDFHAGADAAHLEAQIDALIGKDVDRHLLELTLRGELGFEASRRVDALLDTLRARLVRLKVDRRTTLQPDAAELEALTQRRADPLIARVASRLVAQAQNEDATLARLALSELYHALRHTSEG